MNDPIGPGPACWETLIFPATDHYRKAVVPVKADRENRLENLDITHPCPSAPGQYRPLGVGSAKGSSIPKSGLYMYLQGQACDLIRNPVFMTELMSPDLGKSP